MDELVRTVATVIEQYAGIYLIMSIALIVVFLILFIAIFVYVFKSMRDIDKEIDDMRHFRR